MKISFIGAGYVGLVSGVALAHLGHEVTCIDVDEDKINKLKKLEPPIYEKGLPELLKKYGNSKNLQFASKYDENLTEAECLFITVGTPEKEDGDADLKFIFSAIENSIKYISESCIVVLKSTVPPGTCSKVREFLRDMGKNIEIVSNPEFLREGTALSDFLEPDRIVVGAQSSRAFEIMEDVYKPFVKQKVPIIKTDTTTSELIKYASNSFLANKIAFINEMSDLCEKLGADVKTLANGMGTDKRIGRDFLNAGPGFGGSCFPKDIKALKQLTKKVESDFLILDAIIKANDNRPSNIVDKLLTIFNNDFKGKVISLWGLTYKAGTDDIRNSPAIKLVKILKEKGTKIVAYDPKAICKTNEHLATLNRAETAIESTKGADCIIIATEWEEFTQINFSEIKKLVKTPIIFDLRNILDGKEIKSYGFQYYSLGSIQY